MPKQITFLLLFLFTMPTLLAGSFPSPTDRNQIITLENIFLWQFADSPITSLPQFYSDLPDLRGYSVKERFVAIFQSIFQQMNKPSTPFRVRVPSGNETNPYYEFYVDYFEPVLRVDFIANGFLYHALILDDDLYLSTISLEWKQEPAALNKTALPWNEIFPAKDYPRMNFTRLSLFISGFTQGLLPQDSRARSH